MRSVRPDELARYLAGELSAEDRARVQQWLEVHPTLRARLEGTAPCKDHSADALLARIHQLAAAAGLDSAGRHEDDFEAVPPLTFVRDDRAPVRRQGARRTWRRIAASAMAAAIILAAAMFLISSPEPQTYITAAGAREQITLADGSTIELNAASRLVVKAGFGEDNRVVELEGQAFFDVAPDSAHPFIIATDRAMIRVVGTSFDVTAYASDMLEVVVAEGRVALSTSAGASAELLPGQRGRFLGESGRIEIDEPALDDALAWRSGRLVFRGTSLGVVARRLERHYGVSVHIPPTAASMRLDATFDNATVADVAALIAEALALEVRVDSESAMFTHPEASR